MTKKMAGYAESLKLILDALKDLLVAVFAFVDGFEKTYKFQETTTAAE